MTEATRLPNGTRIQLLRPYQLQDGRKLIDMEKGTILTVARDMTLGKIHCCWGGRSVSSLFIFLDGDYEVLEQTDNHKIDLNSFKSLLQEAIDMNPFEKLAWQLARDDWTDKHLQDQLKNCPEVPDTIQVRLINTFRDVLSEI